MNGLKFLMEKLKETNMEILLFSDDIDFANDIKQRVKVGAFY